jgi:hypothetical protein
MRIIVAVAALSLSADTVSAQLRIRAPFVRVDVNGGVHVRAPFVNLFIPSSPPVYVAPLPPPAFVPPPTPLDETEPPAVMPRADGPRARPAPRPRSQDEAPPPVVGPPPAVTAPAGLTVETFVKSFKPKAGNYEIELINPVNNQPTTVRFTLPEGTPRRVHVSRREIEFDYGARQYVKIQFDSDGAVVIAR